VTDVKGGASPIVQDREGQPSRDQGAPAQTWSDISLKAEYFTALVVHQQ